MFRRKGRRSRYPLPAVMTVAQAFSALIALSAGLPAFTMDNYTVDGVSGKVRAFVDWNDPAHLLDQATSANQVVIPAAAADANGRAAADFTGALWYQSNRPASYWARWHNGTPTMVLHVLAPKAITTSIGWATGATAAAPSYLAYQNSAVFTFNIPSVLVAMINGGTATVGTPTYLLTSYDEAATPKAELRQRSSQVGSTSLTTVQLGNPPASMYLGRSSTGTGSNERRFAAISFPFSASDPRRALVDTYAQKIWGIPA